MSKHEQSKINQVLPAADLLADVSKSRLLNSREAAQYLSLSEPTLRKWRVIGGGPLFVKFGLSGRVCYRMSDLDAFIEARVQTSTSDQRE